MHSTLVNLIKTSIAKNHKQWDENLKYINFVINTTTNQTTGHSPYELTFGRTPNIPSTVNTSPNSIDTATHMITYNASVQPLLTETPKNRSIKI